MDDLLVSLIRPFRIDLVRDILGKIHTRNLLLDNDLKKSFLSYRLVVLGIVLFPQLYNSKRLFGRIGTVPAQYLGLLAE